VVIDGLVICYIIDTSLLQRHFNFNGSPEHANHAFSLSKWHHRQQSQNMNITTQKAKSLVSSSMHLIISLLLLCGSVGFPCFLAMN